MKSVIAFWSVVLTALGGLLVWRNRRRYRQKSMAWAMGKSVAELLILFLTAAFLTPLLIVWLIGWSTRPIKNPWVRTIMAVVYGLTFGLLSSIALEVLIFFGVFSIDLQTGSSTSNGFLSCWQRTQDEESQRQPRAA